MTKTNQIICGSIGPVADVTLDTPLFTGCKAANRLNRYYRHAEACFIDNLKMLSYPLTLPLELRVTITYSSDELISMYREIVSGSKRVRIADTWQNGFPCDLKNLGLKKKDILRCCTEQAEILERSGYIVLFPNYRKLIYKQYRPECFYIQDGNVIVFYNTGVIASEHSGIIEFKCTTF